MAWLSALPYDTEERRTSNRVELSRIGEVKELLGDYV